MIARVMTVACTCALAAALLLPHGFVAAEPLADVAQARVEETLPPHLTVAGLYLAAKLASLDVDPASVAITWPRPPRAGTASVTLTWGKRERRAVPVTLAARPSVPAVPRGTAVTVEVRRGAIRVSRAGVLERDTHEGDLALVRVAPDRPALQGRLVGPALVVIGEVTP